MKNVLFVLIFLAAVSVTSNAQVSVIVNPNVPVSSLNDKALANIYSLTTTKWGNGARIVVIDQKDKNTTKLKFYQFIRKDPVTLQKDWLRKVITGEAKAPEPAGSDDDIIRKVMSTPGAIGYVKSSSVTGGVKVVKEI